MLAREQDNFRAALDFRCRQATRDRAAAGPGAGRLLAGPRIVSRKPRAGWNAPLATGPADPRLRADLLRLLGTVLYSTATRSGRRPPWLRAPGRRRGRPARGPGPDPGAALGNPGMLGRTDAEALDECEAAAAVLEAEGDLEGLAEAWIAIGVRHMHLGDMPAAIEALERAGQLRGGKRQPPRGTGRRGWLVSAFVELPVPADVAIGRAEQLPRSGIRRPMGCRQHPRPSRAALRLRRPLRRRPRGDHACPVRAQQMRGEDPRGPKRHRGG